MIQSPKCDCDDTQKHTPDCKDRGALIFVFIDSIRIDSVRIRRDPSAP